MAKTMVEVLVDDLDGSEAVESVRIGWNGQWRELELSEKNLAALSKSFDRFWDAGRPVRSASTPRRRGRSATKAGSGHAQGQRDPKAIRAWATAQGIAVPSRGRIPRDVEERYHRALARSS
jgi:nucleoid-associated protein Lsr2